jgi:predicted dehydrogenase
VSDPNRTPSSARSRPTRRRFLATAAGAVAAPFIVSPGVLGLRGATAPSGQITIGIIGCGGMGRGNMNGFMQIADARVVAVCDVDKQHVEEAAAEANKRYKNEDCAKYSDFRQLLAHKDLDAVCIATPDHWHALCGIAAAAAKKDIYCQKPMTHTFVEGRALADAVKKNNVVFQVGSQQRSHENFRLGAETVINGHLGKIQKIEVGLPTGSKEASGDTKVQDPPAHIDYDFWCGPSEKLPYMPARLHWNWRWHLAYGGGQLMDWIGHHNDIAHWGIGQDEGGPKEVQAVGFEYPKDRTVWNSAWKYEVVCKYEGGITTSISNQYENGCKWIGESGWLFVTRGPSKSSNEAWIKPGFDPGPKKLYKSDEHHRNFLDCVKSRKPCICTAEIGHRSITPGHLGLLSEALGGKLLQWDAKTETVVGNPDADKLLKSVHFRSPWLL